MYLRNKGIMKLQIAFITCVALFNILLAPLAYAQLSEDEIQKYRTQKPSEKARHLIVLVHGLGGSRDTFGDLDRVLNFYMSYVDPSYNYIIRPFEYRNFETDEQGTFVYASKLGEFIKQQFAKNKITKEDKISIIAHSQGGLVSIIWYIENMVTLNHKPYAEYAEQVDSLITIGTPLWGSKLAAAKYYRNASKDVEYSPIQLLEQSIDMLAKSKGRLSEHELHDMGFLSDVIYRFRIVAISLDQKGYKFKARPLNIAGVVPKVDSEQLDEAVKRGYQDEDVDRQLRRLLWLWPKTGFGHSRYEGDQAVLVPSARVDFIYGIDRRTDYDSNEVMKFNDFRFTQATGAKGPVPFVLAETVHASLDPNAFYDMADVPYSCIYPRDCQHPTLRYILTHLLNCSSGSRCDKKMYTALVVPLFSTESAVQASSKQLQSELRGFTLDVNLVLPRRYEVPLAFRGRFGFDKVLSFERLEPYNKNLIRSMANAILGQPDLADGELISSAAGQDYKIFISRSHEYLSAVGLSSHLIDLNGEEVQHMRYFLTGVVVPQVKFKNKAEEIAWLDKYKEGFALKFRVQMPGLKTRQVVARIKPTYSTYVDLQLWPYD